jgi:phytoene dehydrogenase-like protein
MLAPLSHPGGSSLVLSFISFSGIEAPGNVIIISIPSLLDPSLAPPGCHTIHAYTAGNEPYAPWDGLGRKGPEYQRLKDERSQILWRALEKVIPDVRSRVKVRGAISGPQQGEMEYGGRKRGMCGRH